MRIALPVYNPQAAGKVLLKVDYELDRSIIERLKHLGVDYVWVKYPALQAIERYVKPELLHRRAQLAEQVRHAFGKAQQQTVATMQFSEYVQAVAALVEELLAHPSSMILLDHASESDQPLINHSLRVAYLSVLMGLKLDAYLVNQRWRLHPQRAKQVTNLGLGAMLHDIGMMGMDDQAVQRDSPDERFDDPLWRKHVKRGYDLVGEKVDATARAVVLHHHQHFDGTGFPESDRGDGRMQGVEGTSIHIYARIACAADVFDRLRYGYDGGTPRPTVEAIGQMLQPPICHWIDPVVMRAFVRVTPPYPPGSIVTLSDGRQATTVEHHPDDPCRPSVAIVADDASSDDEPIDLRHTPELSVVEVDGVDVREMNFLPPEVTSAAAAFV